MTHVMLDLETYGTRPGCPVLSIGACIFDPVTGEISSQKFYRVAAVDQSRINLLPEPSTVKWWEEQTSEARSIFDYAAPLDIVEMLKLFAGWLPPDARLWGNGANFDNPILAEAYARAGLEAPWKFYNDRCYRTVKNLAGSIVLKRVGVYHNALDDAISQAGHLVEIVKALGLELG